MMVLGQTRDDAVGEAFDKCAKMLNLPYPGGPIIDQYAKEGNPHAFQFADYRMPGLDYSFSGIKTSVLYFLRDAVSRQPDFIKNNLADLCASIQHTLINMLLEPLHKATQQEGITQVAIAGGVAANSALRERLKNLADDNQWEVFIPKFEYCTDNAAMIAITGDFLYKEGFRGSVKDSPKPRMPF
jgi:N6-L-threonylcarbamoyladenine synthase